MTANEEVARILMKAGAVKLEGGPFTFTSGAISPVYCDNRVLISDPAARKRIVDLYIDRLASSVGPSNVDVIAGTASSGIPFAAWIADRLNKPMVYVRPEQKRHGKMKQVEGALKAGARCIVIEDHISTGGSAIKSVEALRAEGAECSHCFAILAYHTEASQKRFRAMGVDLHVLCDIRDLLEDAQTNQLVQPAQAAEVLAWAYTNF